MMVVQKREFLECKVNSERREAQRKKVGRGVGGGGMLTFKVVVVVV